MNYGKDGNSDGVFGLHGMSADTSLFTMVTYRASQKKKKKQSLDGGYIFKNKKNLEKVMSIFISRSWIYLYNGGRIGMIDKGVPEI